MARGNRNADSPTWDKDGELLFVKPWEEQQPFDDFVDFIAKQELSGSQKVEEVRYAQTRERSSSPPRDIYVLTSFRERQSSE